MVEALRRLRQRIAGMAARGVLRLVNDAAGGQLLQIQLLAGETRDQVQRVQPYGLSSVPVAGAYPVVVLCPHGDRAQALAIVVDDVRNRPTGGSAGDVVLYDTRGNAVRLLDGTLEVVAAGELSIQVTGAAALTIGGNATINVTGNATLQTGGTLDLGGAGGPAVARVGDDVNVLTGKIVSGSAKVKAV